MYLGIEIGGTKLQLGVGRGDGTPLLRLERFDVDREAGAAAILRRIELAAPELVSRYEITAVGCGYGGPVDAQAGRVVKSHHVSGWDNFPLTAWLQDCLGRPARIANDADTAGLAEALHGAGRGANPVLYVTVGTGIGAGLILDGKIYSGCGAGAAELGHLRPGLQAVHPDVNLESLAAGWGIAATAQARLTASVSASVGMAVGKADEAVLAAPGLTDLWNRCQGIPQRLTTRDVSLAAQDGNTVAREILSQATQALGWGLAQAITMLSPAVVVVGGGVALSGEALFFEPLRAAIRRYVFPPFLDKYRVVPAHLGEEVVIHGALSLAMQAI